MRGSLEGMGGSGRGKMEMQNMGTVGTGVS